MKASLETMVPLQGPPAWLWDLTKLSVRSTVSAPPPPPVAMLPAAPGPPHGNADGQGLLEFQSCHYYPRTTIFEDLFWVRGLAYIILQLGKLKPRERNVPKSHS